MEGRKGNSQDDEFARGKREDRCRQQNEAGDKHG